MSRGSNIKVGRGPYKEREKPLYLELLLKIGEQNILEIKSILKLIHANTLLFVLSKTKEMLRG